MNEQKDFQALGRYVDAKERASTLEMHRHNLAGELTRMLKGAVTGTSSNVSKFDHASFLVKANELRDLNVQLEETIAEVNRFAEQADKTKIDRR